MCIFCKIVQGEIPAYKIYEDEKNIAFLDIFPRAKGHTLVIPKKHYETFDLMTPEDSMAFSQSLSKVIQHLKSKLQSDGYNIYSNNGVIAGQEVPHVHFHIFPRFANSKIRTSFPPVLEDIKAQLPEIHKQITST